MGYVWGRIALFLALIVVSPFAMADDGGSVWTIFTLGSGSAVYEVISGVAGIVDRGSGITTIMVILALLGIVFMSAKIGTQSFALGHFIGYLMTIWVVSVLMFNIKVTVVVADRVNNYYNTVQGVPMLFAAPASLISQAGEFLTEKVETFMSLPDQLKITGGGQFNLVAKVVADGSNWKLNDPYLRASVNNYIADCAIPGMARRDISLDTLRTSSNIWSDLKFDNRAVMTRYVPVSSSTSSATPGASGAGAAAAPGAAAEALAACAATSSDDKVALVSCSAAHACIARDLELYAGQLHGSGDLGDLAESGLLRPLGDMMTSSYTWLMGGGGVQGAAATGLSQRIMANSLSGTFRAAAAQAGNNELITTAAVTQAVETQRSGWITSAAVFNDLMGYIFIVLQVVIYGLAPFVAVLLFAPGFGMRGGLAYLQLMVWVALWEPLLALVNFVVAIFARSTIGEVLVSDQGFTFANAAVVSEQANNLMAAAGFMGTMVPMLAWQLAKGTMSMMDFVSQGGGASGGAQAGAMATTGNVSYGNIGVGSTTTGKADLASSVKFGHEGVTASNTPIGHLTRAVNLGGQGINVNNQPFKHEVASSASVTAAERAAQSATMASRATITNQQTEAAQEAITRARAAVSSETGSVATATQVGQSLSKSDADTVASAAASGIQQTEQMARSVLQQNQAALSTMLGLRGNYSHEAAEKAAAGKPEAMKAVAENKKLANALAAGNWGRALAGAAASAPAGMVGGPIGMGVAALVGAAVGATSSLASNIGGSAGSSASANVTQMQSEMATLSKSMQQTASSVDGLLESVGVTSLYTHMRSDTNSTSLTQSSAATSIAQQTLSLARDYAVQDMRSQDQAVASALGINMAMPQSASVEQLALHHGQYLSQDRAASIIGGASNDIRSAPLSVPESAGVGAASAAIQGRVQGATGGMGGAPGSGAAAEVQRAQSQAQGRLDNAQGNINDGAHAPVPGLRQGHVGGGYAGAPPIGGVDPAENGLLTTNKGAFDVK